MTASGDPVFSVFERPSPALPGDLLTNVAAERYGIGIVDLKPLGGERDQNLLATDESGRRFLVRVTNSAEPSDVTSMTTQALLHLAAAAPTLPVQRVVETRDRQPWVVVDGRDGPMVLRILTFLEGRPLSDWTSPSPAQCRAVGGILAAFHDAMAPFSHPASRHDIIWDVTKANRVRPLMEAMGDAHQRRLCEQLLDRFERSAAPLLPALRCQVVHNDPNLHNILVDPERPDVVAGLIDLGDIMSAPRIVDPCIAAAALPLDDTLSNAGAVFAAYDAVDPFTAAELDAIPGLVAARLALTLAISAWRVRLHPENARYILKNAPRALGNAEVLTRLSDARVRDSLTDACQRGNDSDA